MATLMRTDWIQKGLVCLLLVCFFAITACADEDALQMLFVKPGGAGSAEEAAPYMAELSAEVAQHAKGLKIEAAYHNDAQAAFSDLQAQSYDVALVSLGFYLAHGKALDMDIILRTRPRNIKEETYRLLVHKDSSLTLDKILTLSGNVVIEEAFARRIILENKTQAAFTPTLRPLSDIRKVSRGQLEAVLIDEAQYQGLQSLPYLANLKIIFTSKPLPTPVVVALGDRQAKQRTQLKKALLALGKTENGELLLEDLQLDGFAKPLASEVYLDLERLYHATP